MNFDNQIFRCSQLGKLMTPPKSAADKANGGLSETAKGYLNDLYREVKYSRRKDYSSKYITKGLQEEESAITLLSRVKKHYFRKNAERLYNKYLTGEPDLFKGESVHNATSGWDTKCSWDIFTFPLPGEKLNRDYLYQNHGYMALTGAAEWTTAYCLVNSPASLIIQEKKSTWFQMDCPDETNQNYIDRCIEIEKNMIYDLESFLNENPRFDMTCSDWKYDIPMRERVIEFKVCRDEAVIESAYQIIRKARTYLNELEAKINPSAMIASYDSETNATIIDNA